MTIRRTPVPDSDRNRGSITLPPCELDITTLERLYNRFSRCGKVTIRVGSYELDEVQELADVPNVSDIAVIGMRSEEVLGPGLTSQVRSTIEFEGATRTLSWDDDRDGPRPGVAREVEEIVRARAGSWLKNRFPQLVLGTTALVPVLLMAVFGDDVSRGASSVAAKFVAGSTIGSLFALAVISISRYESIRVRVRHSSGVRAQIRDKWMDWLIGGAVVGALMIVIDNVI